jgi:hypothetical protein
MQFAKFSSWSFAFSRTAFFVYHTIFLLERCLLLSDKNGISICYTHILKDVDASCSLLTQLPHGIYYAD